MHHSHPNPRQRHEPARTNHLRRRRRGAGSGLLGLLIAFGAPLRLQAQSEEGTVAGECARFDFFCQINAAFDQLVCRLVDFAGPLIVATVNSIPTDAIDAIVATSNVFSTLDAWIGLGFLFSLLAAWLAIATTFAATKIVIKLIPTIG